MPLSPVPPYYQRATATSAANPLFIYFVLAEVWLPDQGQGPSEFMRAVVGVVAFRLSARNPSLSSAAAAYVVAS